MRTSATTALLEPSSASNRRQPIRQTRTNPSRHAATASRPLGGRGSLGTSQDDRPSTINGPGFFPAITHFTDSIVALPKEMIRHSTMLKEVDAKIYGPEDTLKKLVAEALRASVPPSKVPTTQRAIENGSNNGIKAGTGSSKVSASNDLVPSQELGSAISETQSQVDDSDRPRREHFFRLRMIMGDILPTLDEKNHVLATATDALDKQLARCERSYTAISGEISEEARFGNLHHWAYMDKSTEKKGTTAGERTRRENATAHALANSTTLSTEGELAALRSESRREVLAARKLREQREQRNQHGDSDFDDARGGKKAIGKGRKAADITSAPNLGITNGTNGINKRRKIEKPPGSATTAALPMERSLSGVFGQNSSTRGRAGSPRDATAADATKRRGRGGSTVVNGSGRRRAGTNASAINSPLMASSPIVGTFSTITKGGNSPALGTMQRTQSSRARQNSIQQDPSRNQAPSAAKQANGSSVHNAPSEADKPVTTSTKASGDGQNLKTEDNGNAETETRTSSRSNDRSALRREESTTVTSRPRPPSISTSVRGGKTPKTGTPVSSSFPETSRPRSGRTGNLNNFEPPIKRSHKKGAGIAAQLAAAAAAAAAAKEEDTSSIQDDEEENHDGEPRYCYCNGYSYGEMVACDFEGCAKEWFHLECAALSKAPTGKTKWYCDDCKKKMKSL